MSEPLQTSGRYQRVTTRRHTLRVLECPLEPELLVAEFADELPPDVARAVREHIAVCEICGGRSRALQTPYQVIASLGNEPVPYVPDLRDNVKSRLAQGRTTRRIFRLVGALGSRHTLAALAVVGALALVGFLLFGIISASAQNLSPSTNQLSSVPVAAAQGTLLAETDKLVTVAGTKGAQWKVAEVIAVNERNGSVQHLCPPAVVHCILLRLASYRLRLRSRPTEQRSIVNRAKYSSAAGAGGFQFTVWPGAICHTANSCLPCRFACR